MRLSSEKLVNMEAIFPQFAPEQNSGGRWFVAVKTGKGPDSHIGDFETEESAKDWISTKAKYWPGGDQSGTG
jgi:hypothetical protein